MYADPEGNAIISSIVIGGFVGLFLGFTLTAYSDYIDDGDVFNGSIDTKDYVANTLVTGIIGLGVGYVAPSMSSFLSNSFTFAIPSLAGNGALSITLTGTQAVEAVATIGSIVLLASAHRPGNNKKQNKQFEDAMRKLGITDRDKMRRVHDKLKGTDLGYRELIEFIKSVLNLK